MLSRVYKKNSWINTGDQGFLFEDELYLWGRIKDVLIVNGRNIDPTYVEMSCRNIDSIRTGNIVVVHDYRSEMNEKLILFAESSTTQKEQLKKEIRACVLRETGILIHQVEILKRGELPRTSSGKIQRSQCLESYYSSSFRTRDRGARDMTKLLIHHAKLKAMRLLKDKE